MRGKGVRQVVMAVVSLQFVLAHVAASSGEARIEGTKSLLVDMLNETQ